MARSLYRASPIYGSDSGSEGSEVESAEEGPGELVETEEEVVEDGTDIAADESYECSEC